MSNPLITKNKKALFNYHVEERFEAGIVLTGSEVKSLRAGGANLVDSYVSLKNNEAFLLKAHISPYQPAAMQNHVPTRPRKLLFHRAEILKLQSRLQAQGYTLIPMSLYFKKGRAKAEIGLCRSKTKADKRENMKKQEAGREMQRVLRGKNN
ncbi:MAG: SsrA-binding protein SmpB [Deltaproteobacteria bacterium]|nr:SsrA-binding protein SmpB [Deltaproteobacteria bacterium]